MARAARFVPLSLTPGRRRAPAEEDVAVRARPMIKSARKARYTRCRKCGKQLRRHTVRWQIVPPVAEEVTAPVG